MSCGIFIFTRDLRLEDNIPLIQALKDNDYVLPIFVFNPEQITDENSYKSNNSVQFMVESLHELSETIKEKSGKLYFYYGDTLTVLKKIHNDIGINSLAYNIDYTPFAVKRDNELRKWTKDNNIILYEKEDYVLYDILEGHTNKKDNTPYLVYTPFKNHPDADFLCIVWPMGLIQVSCNPFKEKKLNTTDKHYAQRIEEIKKELIDLFDEKKWNDIIWMTIKFKPYETLKVNLYEKENGDYLTTLIGPTEWKNNYTYIGTFVLSSDSNTFRKI